MVFRRIALGVLAAGLLAGCASAPKEEPVFVADGPTLMRIRDSLGKMDPSARVGQVDEVNPDENTASVGNIDTTGLAEGEIVTFLDGNQKPLTTGKIIRVLPGAIHVKYTAPLANGRPPIVGDLAVRFK